MSRNRAKEEVLDDILALCASSFRQFGNLLSEYSTAMRGEDSTRRQGTAPRAVKYTDTTGLSEDVQAQLLEKPRHSPTDDADNLPPSKKQRANQATANVLRWSEADNSTFKRRFQELGMKDADESSSTYKVGLATLTDEFAEHGARSVVGKVKYLRGDTNLNVSKAAPVPQVAQVVQTAPVVQPGTPNSKSSKASNAISQPAHGDHPAALGTTSLANLSSAKKSKEFAQRSTSSSALPNVAAEAPLIQKAAAAVTTSSQPIATAAVPANTEKRKRSHKRKRDSLNASQSS